MGIRNKISPGYVYFLSMTVVACLDEKMNYIHQNPVKAELVANLENYLYSSARDYAGEKGLVEIEFV